MDFFFLVAKNTDEKSTKVKEFHQCLSRKWQNLKKRAAQRSRKPILIGLSSLLHDNWSLSIGRIMKYQTEQISATDVKSIH